MQNILQYHYNYANKLARINPVPNINQSNTCIYLSEATIPLSNFSYKISKRTSHNTQNRLFTLTTCRKLVQINEVPPYSLNEIPPADLSIIQKLTARILKRTEKTNESGWRGDPRHLLTFVVLTSAHKRLSRCNCTSGTSILLLSTDINWRKACGTEQTNLCCTIFAISRDFLSQYPATQINCAIIAVSHRLAQLAKLRSQVFLWVYGCTVCMYVYCKSATR